MTSSVTGMGDEVQKSGMGFVIDVGEVALVNRDAFLFAVWANNHGNDGGDSVDDVRRLRQADVARSRAKWDRLAARAHADPRSEEEIEESLPAQLAADPSWGPRPRR